jgi:outer membrane protein OmpA-like peptidoglycan-associated protein
MTKLQMNSDLPRRSLGELIILSTTPVSSTGMIMSSYEAMQIGDGVEMMEEPPPPPPPPATLTVLNPPSIACAAEPGTVHAGETATVRCTGTSPDNRPLTYTFVSDAGMLNPRESVATVDTRGAAAGVISVMTTATDDRNLSASATTRVNVEVPPPPAQPSRLDEFLFKPNSAYVDNTAKAALDGVALRLQREANSGVMFVGYSALAEAARLGIARATNAKTYLTKDKGIDGSRIQVRDGGKGGRRVESWFVPAGAAMPDVKPIVAPAAPAKPAATTKKSATPAKPAAKKPAPQK